MGKFLDDVALVIRAESGDASFAAGLEPLADVFVLNMSFDELISQVHVKFAGKTPGTQGRFDDGDIIFADDYPRPVTAADGGGKKRYGHVFG